MVRKDTGKPAEISLQEQSAQLHQEVRQLIAAGGNQDIFAPNNVFAMTFAINQTLLEQMAEKRISIAFRLEHGQVRISLVRAESLGNLVDFSRAQTDTGYRNSLLKRWYISLARALQDTDEKKSAVTAREVIEYSAVPLGLVTDENGRSISIFDLAQPDLKASFQNFESMQWQAQQKSIDRGGIYDYLSGLWDIIGKVDSTIQLSMTEWSPQKLGTAAAGSAVHSW